MDPYALYAGDDSTSDEQAKALAQALRGRRAAGIIASAGQNDLLKDVGKAETESANTGERMLGEAGAHRASNRLQEKGLQQQADVLKQNVAHQKVEEDQGQQRIGLEGKNLDLRLAMEKGEKVKAFASAIEPHAEFFDAVNAVKDALAKADAKHEAPPGIGPIIGTIGEVFPSLISSEGKNLAMRVNQLAQSVDRMKAGMKGAASVPLIARMAKATGLMSTGNVDQMREGLKILEESANADIQAKKAGFGQDVIDVVQSRNPSIPLNGPQRKNDTGLPDAEHARLMELRAKKTSGALK